MNQIFGIISNIDLLNVHVNVQPDDNADQKIFSSKMGRLVSLLEVGKNIYS